MSSPYPVHQIPATHIEIVEGRWEVVIRITKPDGTLAEFVASADSAYTHYSGIFFGTREEFDERREWW
ncbi:MAG: hypothetical protein IRY85_10025 [Micromonosporaceae bacterium]|nr:hypothetical protein [Micromonosporaceae bacterium]